MGSRSGGANRGARGSISSKQRDYMNKLIAKGMSKSEANSVVRMFGSEIQAGFPLPQRYNV